MVYLGVRPRGFSGFHVNGRETFLAGISWDSGWPIVDESAYEIPPVDHGFVEDFAESELNPRWISPGRLPASFTSWANPGRVLHGPGERGDSHHLLAVRPQDDYWMATASLSVAGGSAGLTLRVDEFHVAEVIVSSSEISSVIRVGDIERRRDASAGEGEGITLFVRARPHSGNPLRRGPDVIEVGYFQRGVEEVLDTIDGRYISVELAGGWTGRVVGVRILRGSALLSRFAYRPRNDRAVARSGERSDNVL